MRASLDCERKEENLMSYGNMLFSVSSLTLSVSGRLTLFLFSATAFRP